MFEYLDIVYQKNQYIVWEACNGYVIWNTDKDFEVGHTHLESFARTKEVIDNMLDFNFPLHYSNYFLESMRRLSNSRSFTQELEELRRVRKSNGKKQGYRNINNGIR